MDPNDDKSEAELKEEAEELQDEVSELQIYAGCK